MQRRRLIYGKSPLRLFGAQSRRRWLSGRSRTRWRSVESGLRRQRSRWRLDLGAAPVRTYISRRRRPWSNPSLVRTPDLSTSQPRYILTVMMQDFGHSTRHTGWRIEIWWLGSVAVRTLDLRSRRRWFDSRSGRYQVICTWMGDCLRTGNYLAI